MKRIVVFTLLFLVGAAARLDAQAVDCRAIDLNQEFIKVVCAQLARDESGRHSYCNDTLALNPQQQYFVLDRVCGATPTLLECKTFLECRDKHVLKKCAPLAIILNHPSSSWRVEDLKGESRRTAKRDANVVPTVPLRGSDRPLVALENTNPLIFSLTRGEVAVADSDNAADFKKLVTTVGTSASSALLHGIAKNDDATKYSEGAIKYSEETEEVIEGKIYTFVMAAYPSDAKSTEGKRLADRLIQAARNGDSVSQARNMASKTPISVPAFKPKAVDWQPPTLPEEFDDLYLKLSYTSGITREIKKQKQYLAGARAAAIDYRALQQELVQASEKTVELASHNDISSVTKTDCNGLTADSSARSYSEKYKSTRDALRQTHKSLNGFPCYPCAEKYLLLIRSDPTKPQGVYLATLEYGISRMDLAGKCGDAEEFFQSIDDSVAAIKTESDAAALATLFLEGLHEYGRNLITIGQLTEGIGAAKKAVREFLEKASAERELSVTVDRFADRCFSSFAGGRLATWVLIPIVQSTSVPPSPRPAWKDRYQTTFEKTATHPFTITVDPSFAKTATSDLPSGTKTSFKTVSHNSQFWDFGAGVTFTDLEPQKWAAEPDPDWTQPPDDVEATQPNVITKAGTENRDGKLAVFANWRFAEHLFPGFERKQYWIKPGIELGVGSASGSPSGFAGLSLQLGKYIRVAWGRTVQEINVLSGVKEGDIVLDTASIPLTEDYAYADYLSVTISLSTVSLFKGGG